MLDFIKNNEESDERYSCYNIKGCIRIFNQKIDDAEEIRINISNNTCLESVLDAVNKYIEWICKCEDILKTYYENELGHKVYNDWFEEIEVYSAELTFNSSEDYGATIYCGDQIIRDHILEIDFDKMSVEVIRLNG
jgi:hypothetical protein